MVSMMIANRFAAIQQVKDVYDIPVKDFVNVDTVLYVPKTCYLVSFELVCTAVITNRLNLMVLFEELDDAPHT